MKTYCADWFTPTQLDLFVQLSSFGKNVAETISIKFKQTCHKISLNRKDANAWKEFANDISSLANSLQTGYLLFGIKNKCKVKHCFVGIEETIITEFSQLFEQKTGKLIAPAFQLLSNYIPQNIPILSFAVTSFQTRLFCCIKVESTGFAETISDNLKHVSVTSNAT